MKNLAGTSSLAYLALVRVTGEKKFNNVDKQPTPERLKIQKELFGFNKVRQFGICSSTYTGLRIQGVATRMSLL